MLKMQKTLTAGAAFIAFMATRALADPIASKQLQLEPLPGKSVWNSDATITPLAFDERKKPATILIKVPANQQAKKAHATGDGKIRFAIVLSGTLYYADGEQVEKAKEKAFPAGSVVLISSGVPHWVSTRDEPLQLLLTATDPANLSPPVKMQLGMGKMVAQSEAKLGDLTISGLFARATAGRVKAGGAFMTIMNAGDSDKLISASSVIAERTELHTHIKDGDIMRMRKVDHVDVPSQGMLALKPGGYHLMFINLKQPLKEGQSVPVTLSFEKAGSITIEIEVGTVGAQAPMDHSSMSHDMH